MHAAVVNAWGSPLTYSSFSLPEPTGNQVRVKILAAGLHTLVRSRAAGRHFSVANSSPPHIPGTDGVGMDTSTNTLVYFNSLRAPTGSFADEINIDRKDLFPLPEGADPDTIAVLVNPAMSSWMALAARAGINSGVKFSVAIIGATGVSGQAAVQIASAMGAERIIAIGKPGAKLEKTVELGATATIALKSDVAETDFAEAADVDVVLDYLWGDVTKATLPGIVKQRNNKSQRLTWVEIGALGGEELAVPASLLRMANVALLGCGPGSWTFSELYRQMDALLKTITHNDLRADFAIKKLVDVESWWNEIGGARPLIKP